MRVRPCHFEHHFHIFSRMNSHAGYTISIRLLKLCRFLCLAPIAQTGLLSAHQSYPYTHLSCTLAESLSSISKRVKFPWTRSPYYNMANIRTFIVVIKMIPLKQTMFSLSKGYAIRRDTPRKRSASKHEKNGTILKRRVSTLSWTR